MNGQGRTFGLSRDCGRGFTLIELLVTVAIIGILAAILLPSLSAAKAAARSGKCLHNLRQMTIAAAVYAAGNDDYYPIAYYSAGGTKFVSVAWDYTTSKDWSTPPPTVRVQPGLLWDGSGVSNAQQCPSFEGEHNWLDDPHTGYNYNTSYIGHGAGESIVAPARTEEVRRPGICAIFGDGEYSGGANKFMRAPLPNPGDESFTGRWAGTQGYRHHGRTNVAFCDGHAESWVERHLGPFSDDKIAPGTGFLSEDNRVYDLK